MRLYEKLDRLETSDWVPFHMPGHKRNAAFSWALPFGRDITEIEGFDNLHHPREVLLSSQQELARQVGARRSFFLVNGSTAGILMALSAAVKKGGRILMARGCHKAAYHGVLLRDLRPVYLPAEVGDYGLNLDIKPEEVERKLISCPDIEAVFLTSPTYDGVVSDIRSVAELCHQRNIPLIVDEAHGAHLRFSTYFPSSAVEAGADVVIQSFHKTLPALTQSAVLHLCSDLVEEEKLCFFSNVYQTSSPSYLLLESLDRCVEYGKVRAWEDFEAYVKILDWARGEIEKMPGISLLTPKDCFAFDRSKLLLSASSLGIGGGELMRLLREDHIELEMETEEYCLALSSVGDTKENFERLIGSLKRISGQYGGSEEDREKKRKSLEEKKRKKKEESDKKIIEKENKEKREEEKIEKENENREEKIEKENEKRTKITLPRQVLPLGEAYEGKVKKVSWEEAAGLVSADFAYLYPPGIPLVVPGEVFEEALLEEMKRYKSEGRELHGLRDEDGEYLWVVEESGLV